MRLIIVLPIAALLLSACTAANVNLPANSPSPSPVAPNQSEAPVGIPQGTSTSLVINLDELNNSGQSGTATLTETTDGKTRVVLNLTGGDFLNPQPAHIHQGKCPDVGDIRFPLNTVTNGQSETVLDISLNDLENYQEPLAINVHKSAQESDVYTACGNLKTNMNNIPQDEESSEGE